MKNNYKHWRFETESDGITWLTIDVAEHSTNMFSSSVFEELDSILDGFEDSPPKGLVILSGKSSGFIAGADIKEFSQVKTREDALRIIKRGQDLMDRVDALPCPTVAAITGFCMGGGTELALACDYRVGLDDPKTRISLPEIRIGIHPGYGGTVRALRILGPITAMDMILTGRSFDARRAHKMGFLDHVTPERYIKKAARELITTLPRQHRPPP